MNNYVYWRSLVVLQKYMKEINHNYWLGKYEGKDADSVNPDLRIAMQKLYGDKGFDFGKVSNHFYDKDERNQYRADGYSSYTSLYGNYITWMPFRHKAVESNKTLSERCRFLTGTIAGELFFPARKLNGNTMNQTRGVHSSIKDMVYLTLESIKKYYMEWCGDYPLKETIERYGYFFDNFNSFDEYIEYNLLQDYEILPKKFPTSETELVDFWKKSIVFLEAGLQRIEEYARRNNLFDE